MSDIYETNRCDRCGWGTWDVEVLWRLRRLRLTCANPKCGYRVVWRDLTKEQVAHELG